ncbi:hypothetical protein THASP1DRAFT_30198 [Thamnocephalis sphaerospora]|uniref:Protein Asterix n=1 Tax=Thamnocephalis sphaerospora TaxID=78915 RepID=A0A4P9XPQ7_9FUNG|nr:hypothetical protein THASP1DRAFT_30198 [Thamnocephalis sphaerospora]|eukprot:RKP07997.1 hypothetical protein THASP1DRAFT_30198 [Thamnocephalis sphaerospora]
MRHQFASQADPRRPEAIVKYHMPKVDPEDMDPDYYGFLGMVLGMIAAVMRHKWAAWIGLFCCILGLMNEKTSTRETALGMQAFTSLLFSLMALVLQYVPAILAWRS